MLLGPSSSLVAGEFSRPLSEPAFWQACQIRADTNHVKGRWACGISACFDQCNDIVTNQAGALACIQHFLPTLSAPLSSLVVKVIIFTLALTYPLFLSKYSLSAMQFFPLCPKLIWNLPEN